MNIAEDSHKLLQFAIENDDTDLIHLILINERILRQWSLGGYEFGLEIESVLGKFEKTIYNDI